MEKTKEKMRFCKFFLFVFFILLIGNISALANESQAKNALDQAKADIMEMTEKEIPVERVNEIYDDAYQIYSAQMLLDKRNLASSNYNVVVGYADEISLIKEVSIEAHDDLEIFIDKFEELNESTDFSEFEEDYNNIVSSFDDERFEDTIVLIDKGYVTMNEIQSSQTATRIFYNTVTQSIRTFLINYWIWILAFISAGIIILLIFWKTIVSINIRRKLRNLEIQKKTVNGLIQKLQKSYFKTRKISETEYRIKVKKYEELLRDIERRTMVLREDIFKKRKEGKLDTKNKGDKKIINKLEDVEKIDREKFKDKEVEPVGKPSKKKSKKKVVKKKLVKKNSKKRTTKKKPVKKKTAKKVVKKRKK